MKCTAFFIEIGGLHADLTILPVSHVGKKSSTAPLHANPCTFSHFACNLLCLFTIHTRDFLQFTSFRMYARFWSHLLCTRFRLLLGVSHVCKKNFHAPYTRFQVIHLISHVRQLLEPPTLHAGWVTAGHFVCKQKLFCDTHTRGFRQNQPFRVYKPKKLHIPNRQFPKMQHFF